MDIYAYIFGIFISLTIRRVLQLHYCSSSYRLDNLASDRVDKRHSGEVDYDVGEGVLERYWLHGERVPNRKLAVQ